MASPRDPGGRPSHGHQQGHEHGLIGRVAGAVTGGLVGIVPIEAVLDNVDVNAVLDEVDVDRLIERIDVNRVLECVDVEALMARVDVERLVQRAGIPQIVAQTTGHLAGGTLDLLRGRLADGDRLAATVVDRLLVRRRTRPLWYDAGTGLTVPFAGAISRVLAWLVDLGVVLAAYAGAAWVLGVLVDALGFSDSWLTHRGAALLAAVALGGWAAAYSTLCVAAADATVGKWLVGVRVRRVDGRPVGLLRALARSVAFALSASLGLLGLAPIALQRRSRGLHDLIAGTVVVHVGREPAVLEPGPGVGSLR
ncbi:RDD family protein [Nocardioides nematodiphilus]|uniref:RDD family protein n=1 Tax=Nocardioides nematodiphilus TaxID=2849669 RepID=UPI001CD96E56|nr:RDD family protein [Nocardioides nematodiphilus]MCA1982901.1 RDD family protein [Nocardioides nematodiphilus]